MTVKSVNPFTEETIAQYDLWSDRDIAKALDNSQAAFLDWRKRKLEARLGPLAELAKVLRKRRAEWAGLITGEMGKPLPESEAEIEKCAATCEFLAENLPEWLAPQQVKSPKG